MNRPTIMVSVANYRDTETPHTVADLLAKADRPELLRVVVLSQIDAWTDQACLPGEHPQVTGAVVAHDFSRGVCWARSELLTKLAPDDAQFVLQIDSHSRFAPGWDTLALVNYMNCRDSRAVLTCYPTAYIPGRELPALTYTPHRIKEFGQGGIPRFASGSIDLEFAPKEPQRTPGLAGGCLFTKLDTLREVPYDPYLYFGGEEFTMAARLFTHGYNSYTPNQPWMYHQYDDPNKVRPRHWKDNTDWSARNTLSFRRFRHMLGLEPTRDPEALRELEKYCLGGVRSLREYQEFAGLELLDQRVSEKSIHGTFE